MILPKAWKFRSWIAFSISFISRGTTSFVRSWKSCDVFTVACMPVVLLMPFLSALTTRIRAFISGQWLRGATTRATLSTPSSRSPLSQATYPPSRLLQAEPDPCRAMRDSSVGDCGKEYRSAIARTRAAKPAADEASPAAVGKLLTDTRRRGNTERQGSEGSASSSTARRARRACKQAWGRAEEIS